MAEIAKCSKESISANFSKMRKEDPPVIEVVGNVELKFGWGNRKLIYKWIGG